MTASTPIPRKPSVTIRVVLVALSALIGFLCGAAAGVAYGMTDPTVIPDDTPRAATAGEALTLGTFMGGVPGAINGLVLSPLVAGLLARKPLRPVFVWVLLPSLMVSAAVSVVWGPIAAWFAASATFIAATLALRAWLPDHPRFLVGVCPGCGYSMTGLPSERCPECGGPWAPVRDTKSVPVGSPRP